MTREPISNSHGCWPISYHFSLSITPEKLRFSDVSWGYRGKQVSLNGWTHQQTYLDRWYSNQWSKMFHETSKIKDRNSVVKQDIYCVIQNNYSHKLLFWIFYRPQLWSNHHQQNVVEVDNHHDLDRQAHVTLGKSNLFQKKNYVKIVSGKDSHYRVKGSLILFQIIKAI